MLMMVLMMRMRMLALPVMTRRLLSDLLFVICDKKGELFWVESGYVFKERVSIGHF